MPRDPFVPTPPSRGALFHSKGEFDNVEHGIGHHQPDNRPKHEAAGASIGYKDAEHLEEYGELENQDIKDVKGLCIYCPLKLSLPVSIVLKADAWWIVR